MSEKIRTKCPRCETERDIKGTPERVRCPTCSFRYYVKKNIIVPKEVEKEDKKKENGTINRTPKNTDALDSMVHALYPMIKDVSLGRDLNKSAIIEGLNNTIRIYRNSKITREGSRITKKNPGAGKKVLEWVETYENQQPVPLLVVHHPYFQKVLAAYQELEKLRIQ